MKYFYNFLLGIFQASIGSYFGSIFLFAVLTITVFPFVKKSDYSKKLEQWYVDSDSIKPEAKDFFERHYLTPDNLRRNSKYHQAEEENINLFSFKFRKTISLPLFALFALLNTYISTVHIIYLLNTETYNLLPIEYGLLCGYAAINLICFFSLIYARQLYSNFITKGYRLSAHIPSCITTSSIILFTFLYEYMNVNFQDFILLMLLELIICISFNIHFIGDNTKHLFMDKRNFYERSFI